MTAKRKIIKLTHTPTDAERAWAAAFFAGEGCTSLNVGGKRRCINGVTQKEYTSFWKRPISYVAQAEDSENILKYFQRCIGGLGVTNMLKRKPFVQNGKEIVPQDMWRHNINSLGEVQTAMGIMWPYLTKPKKDQFIRIMKEYKEFVASRPTPLKGRAAWKAKLEGVTA